MRWSVCWWLWWAVLAAAVLVGRARGGEAAAPEASAGGAELELELHDDAVWRALLQDAVLTPGATPIGGNASCPADCFEDSTQWCEAQFSGGGTLSGENCSAMGFNCVCNGAASAPITASYPGQCSWTTETFDTTPVPSRCLTTTGRCPHSCADVEREWWPNYCQRGSSFVCRELADSLHGSTAGPAARLGEGGAGGPLDAAPTPALSGGGGGVSLSVSLTTEGDGSALAMTATCLTCAGREYTVRSYLDGSCVHDYSAPLALCDPMTTCNGNGCCAANQQCHCFRSPELGFWAGPQCDRCDDGYESSKGSIPCTTQRPPIQVFLSSFANPWFMVLPNLIVMFLFVVFSTFRCRWESDKPFEKTQQRRANLSLVQLARRNQPTLFHSKYIPKRPAKSKCFVNTAALNEPHRGVAPY